MKIWLKTFRTNSHFKPKYLMKKCLLKLMFLLLASAPAVAQTVTGRVTNSADGMALPGVSVLVKGTTAGTTTDTDGKFSINADASSTLVFSFIGYATDEVAIGGKTTIEIALKEDITQLGEVVVTALGIEKDTKALGYSVTSVKGEEFTKAREINIANALVGKIAGVNSSAPLTGPGGSSRVTIRGNASLNGNNQPLYVVNGIQMNNENLGNATNWGGADMGDGISSINPDDIEDITVLKGGSASALYGQRGRNGVILITTKSGKGRKGLGVEFNSNSTIERIMDFTDFQHIYGQGTQGLKPTTDVASRNTTASAWGPKLDGSTYTFYDGSSKPYSYNSEDNMENFYQTGHTYTNTLGISGGNDAGAFRLSIGRLANTSVYPNSVYNRTTGNLDVNYKLSKKWTGAANLNYTKEDGNRSNLSDSPGNGNFAILFLPPNLDGEWLAPGYDPVSMDEVNWNTNAYATNPYFASNRFRNFTNKDRMMSVASIRYSPLDWLYVQARIANDYYSFRRKSITPTGTAYRRDGGLDALQTINFNEMNTDVLIGASKDLGENFSINATLGANLLQSATENLTVGATGLSFPFIYNPSTAAARTADLQEPTREVHSVYGALELGLKDMLFLNLTDRNDWSSTIPLDNNSYNYYSISGSFVFSELMESSFLNFGKIRAGFAGVGGDADPFKTRLYYGTNPSINGQAVGNIKNEIPNRFLEPLQVQELEIGLNAKLLENRVTLDVAWYDKNTLNDIVSATVSQTSGYDAKIVNVGKLQNTGIELLLGIIAVKTEKFSWTTSFNYTNNKNEVVALAEGQETMAVAESRTQRGYINHVVGKPFSQVMVFDYAKDDAGNLILDGSGLPTASDKLTAMGTGVHPITGGWSNDITFGNFGVSFLIDFKSGGVIYSGTNAISYAAGLHQETLVGREEGVSVNGGAVNTAENYYNRLSTISALHVYNADFIKFRSMSITYSVPNKIFAGKVRDLSVSITGRNLFYIKKNTPNIDPEANYTNSNAQGLEYASLPPVRTLGLNLSAKF
jgi:TonB-linked SusC/RagA family outer membrane protein